MFSTIQNFQKESAENVVKSECASQFHHESEFAAQDKMFETELKVGKQQVEIPELDCSIEDNSVSNIDMLDNLEATDLLVPPTFDNENQYSR